MFKRIRGKAALFGRAIPLAALFAVLGYSASITLGDGKIDAPEATTFVPAVAVTLSAPPLDPTYSAAGEVASVAGVRAPSAAGEMASVSGRPALERRLADVKDGAEIFMTRCMSCHQMNGRGVPGVFPPLAGAEWVTGDKGRLIRIVLAGLTGEVTVENEVYSGAMPPWGSFLDDKQMSELLTYLRSSWGNQASAVSADDVSKVRAAIKERREPWTAAELLKEGNSGIPE